MEIKQLQHFARIAEIGNLTRAASVLGLTQAALSRQVAQLEADLGTELFRRNGRGLTLTEAGERLMDHVPVILRQIAQAERAVRGPSGPIQGTIALGLPPSLGRSMTVPLIEAFKQHLPKVTLRTVDGLSSNLGELVGMGRLDCAIIYGSLPEGSAELRPLAREELYLVSGTKGMNAARDLSSSVLLTEVAELPLVTAGARNAVHTALVRALAGLGLTPTVIHEIENLTAILDLVRKGHGFSVIPLSGIHSCIGDDELRLHRIRQPVLGCELSIATPHHAFDDTLTERCVALLIDIVGQQLEQIRRDVEQSIVSPR